MFQFLHTHSVIYRCDGGHLASRGAALCSELCPKPFENDFSSAEGVLDGVLYEPFVLQNFFYLFAGIGLLEFGVRVRPGGESIKESLRIIENTHSFRAVRIDSTIFTDHLDIVTE